MGKMSKAIKQDKKKVTIKRVEWDFSYIGNLCVQTKTMIRTKWTYPLTPSTVFLIPEKLPSLPFVKN